MVSDKFNDNEVADERTYEMDAYRLLATTDWRELQSSLEERWQSIDLFLRTEINDDGHDEDRQRDLLVRLIQQIRAEVRVVEAAIIGNAYASFDNKQAKTASPSHENTCKTASISYETMTREVKPYYYKLVGMVGGRYFSLYDGVTEYRLEHEVRPNGKGVFVYENLEQAARNRPHLPKMSKLKGAPRVVMRLRPIGKPRMTKSDKIAFEAVIPDAIIRRRQ